jgi:hypothetical protein
VGIWDSQIYSDEVRKHDDGDSDSDSDGDGDDDENL